MGWIQPAFLLVEKRKRWSPLIIKKTVQGVMGPVWANIWNRIYSKGGNEVRLSKTDGWIQPALCVVVIRAVELEYGFPDSSTTKL